MKKLTEAWLRAAQDDLDVIDRILLDDHLTHIVAFHAQQSLEKAFKALFEEHDMENQKIHKLVLLYNKIEGWLDMEMDINILKTLDALYIEARYPGDLGLLPLGRPTVEEAKVLSVYAAGVVETVKKALQR